MTPAERRMTRQELVERIADLIRESTLPTYERIASAALDLALEEAAQIADANALEAWDFGADETRGLMRLQAADIATAIRALKG